VARIEILDRGTIDDRDSAFPQVVELPNGDLIASYSNAGGQFVTGGTDWSRSTDGGRTWQGEGTILAATSEPESTNFLKPSISRDGRTIYAYGSRLRRSTHDGFGGRPTEAIFVTSIDGGRTWSEPAVIPMPTDRLEISHGILVLESGRLLAPAATIEPARYGEQVVVAISDDGGRTWPRHAVAMQDPGGTYGFLEQKLAELSPGRVIASAWTSTLAEMNDTTNSYAISEDGGLTWSAPRAIGTRGQTLSVVPLGATAGDLVMLLYNRRYGEQGIVMAIARMTDRDWPIEFEALLFDARGRRAAPERENGVAEMLDFKFGFPTAIRLRDGSYLASWWSVEDASGRSGVRWAKLQVHL
jgi:sialidase-1